MNSHKIPKYFHRAAVRAIGASLMLVLFSMAARPQVNLGRISGTVTDETGGVLVGAKVTITDQDRGTIRALVTDEAGAYAAPTLTPGHYTVKVEANGFNTTERKDVPVTVGGDTRVDMALKAGSQVQTVTVTEALPLINTTSATLGGVMENREVTDLPVIGRNWMQLLQLTPGVNTKPGGGSNAHASNGMRSDGNNYLFEGIFSGGVRTAGNIINMNSSSGDGAAILPTDAIQEVGVNFQNKAEYGWRPGVASNVGVKSGTNTIHGTAFAQGQTSALNARNVFNPAPNPIPELSYQQYGATVGGPIKKDKIFWFAAFEGMQFTEGTPTNLFSPTTALMPGKATQSIPAAYQDLVTKGRIPAGAIDANGKVVNSALLTPQQQLSAQLVNAGIFQTAVPNADETFNFGLTSKRDPNRNLLGKVDWAPNEKNHITGEYFYSRDTELDNSNTVTQPYWLTDYYLTSNVTRATWSYLPTSTLVNEFHFGYDRKVENQWPSECVPGRAAAPPNYGTLNTGLTPCNGSPNPTQIALFDIGIQGFLNSGLGTTNSPLVTLGGGGGQRRVEGYWTIDNIVSYVHGNHNVKFGFEIRRPYFDGASYSGKLGNVLFGTNSIDAFTGATALEDFLMGFPSSGQYTAGDPTSTQRNWNYGLFGQDDWRITPRLTLNLGLRWEYETALSEDNDKIAIFDPTSPIGLTQLGNGLSSPWNPNKFRKNFQPRLGLAWDITGKGTTVLRAAYGLYSSWPVYNVINGGTANPTSATFYRANGTTIQGAGTIGTGTVTFPTAATGGLPLINWTAAGPMFPTGQITCGNGLANTPANIAAGAPARNPGTCAISAVDQNWRMPYVQQWNIGIQRALRSNLSLDLAYVGTHGTDLFGQVDINEPPAGTTSSTRIQQSRPFYSQFPWMGKITDLGNFGFSNYNGLQATLTQRTWHGLFTTVGYTYSHTLDTAGTDVGLSICPDPTVLVRCNYGPTAFDIRHKVTGRISYNFPSKKSPAQLLEGWQINSVINIQGGIPYDTRDTSDNFSGTGENTDRWDIFGDANDFNGYGRTAHIPCWGVAGSKFDLPGTCTTVAAGPVNNLTANMPAACVNAATSLPVNPSVPGSDAGSTGIKQLGVYGCYMSGNSVIVPPAQGTFGTMGKALFRGAPFQIGDISIRKHTRITERIDSEFAFDMYNVTNHPEFAIPGGNGNGSINRVDQPSGFGRSLATPNVSNGNVVAGSGDARRYQFGLKFIF
jgi:carboxypeptidase family protein